VTRTNSPRAHDAAKDGTPQTLDDRIANNLHPPLDRSSQLVASESEVLGIVTVLAGAGLWSQAMAGGEIDGVLVSGADGGAPRVSSIYR
jgi:hypothetical protein